MSACELKAECGIMAEVTGRGRKGRHRQKGLWEDLGKREQERS